MQKYINFLEYLTHISILLIGGGNLLIYSIIKFNIHDIYSDTRNKRLFESALEI